MRDVPKNTFKTRRKELEPEMGNHLRFHKYYTYTARGRRRTKAGHVTGNEGQLHCCQDRIISNLISVKRPGSLNLVASRGPDSYWWYVFKFQKIA